MYIYIIHQPPELSTLKLDLVYLKIIILDISCYRVYDKVYKY